MKMNVLPKKIAMPMRRAPILILVINVNVELGLKEMVIIVMSRKFVTVTAW